MDTWIWIVLAVLLVALVVLVVGLQLARKRKVSLRDRAAEPIDPSTPPPPPKKGSYTTGSSISFASGGSGTAVLDRPEPDWDRTETDGQPGVGDDAAVPRDAVKPAIQDLQLPEVVLPDVVLPDAVLPDAVLPELAAAPAETSTAEAPPTTPIDTALGRQLAEPTPAQASAPTVPIDQVRTPPPSAAPTAPLPTGAPTAVPAAPVFAPVDRPAPRAERPADFDLDLDEGIEPAEGRLSRLRGRLARSQNTFGKSMLGLLGASDLDDDSWADIEDTLLLADLGAAPAAEIAAELRRRVTAQGVGSPAQARALLRRVLIDALNPQLERAVKALPHDGRPSVVLVVGVNGTGKTTTTGKLARVLVAQGHTVVLGAADTFRAAAADQLATWAERAGATVVRGAQGSDPAAVAFDAVKTGIDAKVDAVLIDTAGRLHTKTGLMDELGKVKRVVEKQAKVDEILLVLDATTGQNGMVQAKVFADVVDITGIVLTKLDGTAKGGIVVAVQRALGVPVKLVGLGEGPDDLAPFEPAAFVDALLGD